MSRSSSQRKFEDVYRIYHEVEDVGKTVKASKRRARWTFSFGETGPEREVILIHSVVSGKKSLSYDGREIYHAEELSRAFTYSWYDGDHVLRIDIVDIVEVGTQMVGKNRNDKMYELTLDGVPFGVLPVKPLHLPNRNQGHSTERQGSFSRSSGNRSSFGDGDDFNPRGAGASSGKPKAVMKTAAAPARAPSIDLLGGAMDDDFGGNGGSAAAANHKPSQPFDPFAGGGGGGLGFDSFAPVVQASNSTVHQQSGGFGGPSFDAFAGGPVQKGGGLTASDLAKELGTLSMAPVRGPSVQQPSAPAPAQPAQPSKSALTTFSAYASDDSPTADVAKATASLVNLNNLMDDGTSAPVNVYKSVYSDNRSLEEMKASQANKPSQASKPAFIERPPPPPPSSSMPMFPPHHQHPQQMYGGGGPGMRPPMMMQQPASGRGPTGLMGGPPPPHLIYTGAGPAAPFLQPPQPMSQGPARPPLQQPMHGGFGGFPPPHFQQGRPPRPPHNDPFFGL